MAYNPNNANGSATSANSAPVVIASDQSAIPITDNSGSITIDNGNLSSLDTKTATAKTTDYDTGAGTDTVQMTGIALPASGGAVAGGTSTNPVRTDPTGTTTQPVSGTVTANAGTNLNTSALATSANLTAGTMKTQVVDGSGNVIGSTSNALDVNIKSNNSSGVVSTSNGTTANLASGAVYTGTGEDVTQYSEMRVSVFSSHASATDGLSIQQSSDNTNWDITDAYTIPATTGKTFVVPRQERYFRVVYTNGGTLTTSLRIQVILNRTGTAPSSQRPGDAYTNETDLVQGQSFLMGYNGTTWDRLRTVGTGVLSASAVLTAGSAIVGKVGIDQTTPGTTNAVVDTPTTAGGLSIVTGSVGATATAIKASAGQLYGYHLFNTTAAVAYVQIFNVAAASVTLGTTSPTISIGIPASGGVTVNFDKGIAFGTAISYACTTTRTGSTGATCDVNFYYK